MKKKIAFFTALCCLLLATNLQAQDLKSATETAQDALQAMNDGKKEEALAGFTKALEMLQGVEEEGVETLAAQCKSVIPGLYLGIAKDIANNGDVEKAMDFIKKAIAASEKYDPDTLVALEAKDMISPLYQKAASAAMNAKEYEKAVTLYKKILEENPDNGNAHLYTGMALNAMGDLDGAIASYENAAANGLQDKAKNLVSKVYLKKAQATMKEQKWAEVYEWASKSNNAAENGQAQKFLGSAAIKLQKWDEAIALYSKLIEANPEAKDIAASYYNLATACENAKKNADAVKYYQKIVTDPKFKDYATAKIKALSGK